VIDGRLGVDEEDVVCHVFIIGVTDIAVLAQFVLDSCLGFAIGVIQPVDVNEREAHFTILNWFLVTDSRGRCRGKHKDQCQ
jgi:hypothetical protein